MKSVQGVCTMESTEGMCVVNIGGAFRWDVSIYGVVYSNMIMWFPLSGSLQIGQPFWPIKLSKPRALVCWLSYGNELKCFQVDNLSHFKWSLLW